MERGEKTTGKGLFMALVQGGAGQFKELDFALSGTILVSCVLVSYRSL
jgi:hypothetical protein